MADLTIGKDKDVSQPAVRKKYGFLGAVVGIVVNLLLFSGKLAAGVFSGSVAITGDALNNLSDAASSIISLVSFHISSKPADKEHPFGHARVEYIASLLVSFIIVFIALELFAQSVDKIFNPTEVEFSLLSVIILSVSIIMKVSLFVFDRRLGKKIKSDVLLAAATDSLSDTLSTSVILVSLFVSHFAGVALDGYMGIVISLVILFAVYRILKDTMNHLLGVAPEKELVDSVMSIISEHEGVLGTHDLVMHNYGPERCFASAHVEVSGSEDVFVSHDMIDNIERTVSEKTGVQLVIHMDPIVTDDEITSSLRLILGEKIKEIESDLTIHDFRLVSGVTHSNLIFDIALPFDSKLQPDRLKELAAEKIKEIDRRYNAVITIDRC